MRNIICGDIQRAYRHKYPRSTARGSFPANMRNMFNIGLVPNLHFCLISIFCFIHFHPNFCYQKTLILFTNILKNFIPFTPIAIVGYDF